MRVLSAALFLALAACGHPRHAELGQQVDDAAQRVAQLEEAVRSGEADVQRIRESLAAHAMGHQDAMETLDTDLQRLQADLEGWHLELRQLKRHVQISLRADERWKRHVDGRLEHMEGMLGVQSAPLEALEPEAAAPATAEEATDDLLPDDLPEAPSALLAEAQERLRGEEPAVARAILEHALEQHGEADEAAEMRYRLAETWFAEHRWGKAASAFQAVAEVHPESDWAAWSLVRQGECHRALGDADTARIYFEDTVRLHPDTKAAQAAKKLSDGLL